MKPIYIFFGISIITTLLGALFKLESWPLASELLVVGTIAWIITIVLIVVRLVKKEESKRSM